MINLFDLETPFLVPLWRRVVVSCLCAGWTAFEVIIGAYGWAVFFGLATLYVAWALLLNFDVERARTNIR